jgi:hypothetical protein
LKQALVLCIAVVLSVFFALAAEAGTPNLEFKVKVSKDGFRNLNGQLIDAPFHVKKGESVRVTFLFDEKTSEVLRDMMRNAQDQHGYVHAFALHSGKEIIAETPELSIKSRETSLDFIAGDKGAEKYKVYCTMMCFGMEHLNDLTIEVS